MKATNKISDFGQKIGGARKDVYSKYLDRMAAVTNDALILKPLSKVYQIPDLSALWGAGEITESQAVQAWYVWTLIEKKPQRYGVSTWAKNTYTLLQVLTDVLTGECDELPDSVIHPSGREQYDYFCMEVKAAGWPEKEYKRGVYKVTKRLFNSLSWMPYTVASGRYYKGEYKTMAEAVARIRELVASERNNENNFEIRHWTKTGERFICPRGKSGIVLRRGIDSSNEARRIVCEEADELKAEYNRLRTFPDERRDWNRPRLGDDFRAGLDINPETFGALVPFRGVEFGNWVNQLERAACLNECADALWDLANITGVRLDVLAQSGTLAMAFGARGVTKARAHYEPAKRVINITKRTGAGCLAHEWFHALDNYIMIREGQPLMYAVSDCRCIKNTTAQLAANTLKIAINQSDYARRSEKIDEYKSKKYWGTMVELSARAFEAYVYFKMEAAGMVNDYLVNFKTSDEYERSDFYPYPTREEAQTFAPLFESFFDSVFSAEERSESGSPSACATPVNVPTIAAPEAEVITVIADEEINEPADEVPAIAQQEAAPVVVEVVTYEDPQKSPIFPEMLAIHRKYFETVETFCNAFNLIYHFDLLNEKKVRLFVMFLNGERVFFDYEVTSRHRDVFAFREHDEKRRRLKNWSVAIETMKGLIAESSGHTPEKSNPEVEAAPAITEVVAYGVAEKSQSIQVAASESMNDAQSETLPTTRPEVELKEEDKDKMRKLNRKNDYCMAHSDLLTLCQKHEKAFAKKDFYTCQLIEYRLTDINFHSECGMLYSGQYNTLKQQIKKETNMETINNAPYGEVEKSQPQLLPENITLQMIADGVLQSEESINVAKHIIAEGMEEQFNSFRAKDKDANESLADLFDTVANFLLFNAEIRFYGTCLKSQYKQFFGMKPEDSLQKLSDYANGKDYELMDLCEFKLRGVKGFLPFNSYLFHQCFAEGRITVDELIKMLQETEN